MLVGNVAIMSMRIRGGCVGNETNLNSLLVNMARPVPKFPRTENRKKKKKNFVTVKCMVESLIGGGRCCELWWWCCVVWSLMV